MGRNEYLQHREWSVRPAKLGRNHAFVYACIWSQKPCFWGHFHVFLLILEGPWTSRVDFGPAMAQIEKLSGGWKFQNDLENRFWDFRDVFRPIWDGPKWVFEYTKMPKMTFSKKNVFGFRPNSAQTDFFSAQTFWIRKMHKKCYLTIYYNVLTSLIVFDLERVEIC